MSERADIGEAETLRPSPAWASDAGIVAMQPAVGAASADPASDRLLIAERIARYGWSFDERDRDGVADCFTEDGVWEGQVMGIEPIGPFAGRASVVEFLTSFWEEQSDQRRHVFANVVVDDLLADTATAHVYVILLRSSEASMTPLTAGPFRLELARDAGDGVWRIARLLAGFDTTF
ncbi:MAG TPA: nuclear transport factor 2 family protein [Solirubrobacteraceae bacterium]|jgi:hypothetical protein|nr:nuclear transport factor 2 family protein [Solirubrobacteraceae bacterium]